MPPAACKVVVVYVVPAKPLGRVLVLMLRAGPMTMEIVPGALRWLGLELSVTVNCALKVPAEVGVPEMTPPEVMVRPAGRPVTVQLYGAVPPRAAMLDVV